MALNAHDENKATLRHILGLRDEEAEQVLSESIALTFNHHDSAAVQLATSLQEILSRTFSHVTTAASNGVSAEIVLSNTAERTQATRVFVRSDGAGRVVISETPVGKSLMVVDPHAAFRVVLACYIAAFTMRRLLSPASGVLPRPSVVTIDFDTLCRGSGFVEGPIDIGTVHLAGAGAIGNGFLHTLKTFDVTGRLIVCDGDTVSDGNLNRCLWFNEGTIGMNKARALVEAAQPHFPHLTLLPHPGNLSTLPEKRCGGPWLERLVVGVDSRRARRGLNSEIPREIYDASTTDIREVFLHFSKRPLHGAACLECAYPVDAVERAHERHMAEILGLDPSDIEELIISRRAADRISSKYVELESRELEGQSYDTLFKELCGKGNILTKSEVQVLAPFAFVSVFAGALLAIEFVRRVSSGAHDYNSFRISPWSSPVPALWQRVSTNPRCSFCTDPRKSAFSERLWE